MSSIADASFQTFKEEVQRRQAVKEDAIMTQNASKRSKLLDERKKAAWQLRRTQNYLGLNKYSRDGLRTGLEGLTALGRPWNENQDEELSSNTCVKTDVAEPPVVFVAVDVEAFEHNQSIITEVGVSVLDTSGLEKCPPGVNGKMWASKIKSYHFGIEEYRHLVNGHFVNGCPDNFHFGETAWMPKSHITNVLRPLFEQPTSTSSVPNMRNTVFVAHNAGGDIKYLKALGLLPCLSATLLDCIDTSDMFMAINQDPRQPALSTLLVRYGITGMHLHNAGNDARYTLEAMLAIALNAWFEEKTTAQMESETERRIQIAIKEAKFRVISEMEGWTTSDMDPVQGYQDGLAHVAGKLVTREENKAPRNSHNKQAPNFKPNLQHRSGPPPGAPKFNQGGRR